MLRIVLKQDGYSEMCFENTQVTVFSDDREAVSFTVFPLKHMHCV